MKTSTLNVVLICVTLIVLVLMARDHSLSIVVRHTFDLTPIVKHKL